MMRSSDMFLTTAEVARLVGVAQSTVRRSWVHDRKDPELPVPVRPMGPNGPIRFHAQEVFDYLGIDPQWGRL